MMSGEYLTSSNNKSKKFAPKIKSMAIRSRPVAKIGKLFLPFYLCLIALSAHAEVNVTSTVDRNQMSLEDTFTYTITVTSDATVEVEQPHLPSFDGLTLL